MSSPVKVPAGCRYLASALSPGTGITPAYPGDRSRNIPALPDAGDSPETGTEETGTEVGESAAERKTAPLTRCTHTTGHRGRGAERTAGCTDIRGYYRHISKAQLKRHTERFIPERRLN